MTDTKQPTILEVDALTGEQVIRNLTSEEISQIELGASQAQSRIAARQSALAKLAALGLTEAEIAAL